MNTVESSTSSDLDRFSDRNVEASPGTSVSAATLETKALEAKLKISVSENAQAQPDLLFTSFDRSSAGRFRILPWTLGMLAVVAAMVFLWKDLPQPLRSPRQILSSLSSSSIAHSSEAAPLSPAPSVRVPPAPLDLPPEAALEGVHLASKRDFTAVELQLNRPVEVHAVRLDHPDRVYLDLANTHLGAGLNAPAYAGKVLEVNDGLIFRIRVAQREPDVARVVLDLKCACEFSYVVSLNPPYRLVIDVQPRS